jgi:hypothetical protein
MSEESQETAEKILDEASRLIYGQRQSDYGSVAENFGRIASIWSMIVGVEITAEQVTLMMIGVKLARLTNTIAHRDSWVDIAGYVGCYDKLGRGE